MRNRYGTIFVFNQKRLGILNTRSARCRIPDVANANRPAQQIDLRIVECFRDKAHAPVGANGLAIVNGDACCLLSPVLQGIECKVNEFGYVIARLIEGDTDNAAGIVQLWAPSNPPFSSTYGF